MGFIDHDHYHNYRRKKKKHYSDKKTIEHHQPALSFDHGLLDLGKQILSYLQKSSIIDQFSSVDARCNNSDETQTWAS